MKITKTLVLPLSFALLLASAAYAAAGDAPRVTRIQMERLENGLNNTLLKFTTDNSHTLIGLSRGVYVDGFGVVLTAEVILVNSSINIMHPVPSKEDIELMHKKKIERVPLLKRVLKDALVSAAASLDSISPEEQITIAVILPRFQFEDASGIPIQITVQGQKKKLLESKGAALDAAVRITEN
jgi:hypothetical protein